MSDETTLGLLAVTEFSLPLAAGAVCALTIAWTIVIALRPTANRKAVLSLTLTLLLVGVSILSAGIGLVLDERVSNMILGLLFLGMMFCLPLASVLAVLGLIDIYKQRGVYEHGIGQAVTTLVVALGFVGLLVTSVFLAVAQRALVPEQAGTEPSLGDRQPELFLDEEFNYSFDLPGSPWAKLDASRINPAASLVLMRRGPTRMFMIIPELFEPESMDTLILVEVVKGTFVSGATNVQPMAERPATIAGMEGIRLRMSGELTGTAKTLESFNVSRNGYAYQLIMVSNGDDPGLTATADKMFTRFRQLAPNRMSQTDADPFAGYTSERFGYQVRAEPDNQWREWVDVAETNDEIDWGVLSSDRSSALAVVSGEFHGQRPSLDMVAGPLLSTLGHLEAKLERLASAPSQPGVQQREWSGTRLSDDGTEFYYILRLMMLDDRCVLAATWTDKAPGASTAALRADLDLVSLVAPALEPPPWEGLKRRTQATFLSAVAREYADARLADDAATWSSLASELIPEDAELALSMVQDLSDANRHEEALLAVRAAMERSPRDLVLRSWLPFILHELDRRADAHLEWEELFQRGYSSINDLALYTKSLRGNGQSKDALDVLDRFAPETKTPRLMRLKAGFLTRLKRHDESIAILEAMKTEGPTQPELAWALISAYSWADRYSDERAVAEELIARGQASMDAWYAKGRAEYGLGWYQQARESLQKALELEPDDEDAQSLLQRVSAALGKGDSASVLEPIEAVAIPSAALAALPPRPSKEEVEGLGAWFEHHTTAVSFLTDKEHRTTTRWRVFIQDRVGVDLFGTLTIDFDPLHERLFVNRLQVFSADGKLEGTADVHDSYVLDKSSYMASTDRQLHIPVPGLQPGSVLELEYTRSDHNGPHSLPYLEAYLGGRRPAQRRALFLTGDIEHVRFSKRGGIQHRESSEGLLWWIDSPEPLRNEANQPHPDTFAPWVRFVDDSADWEGLGADYLEDLSEYLVAEESVTELARKLTSGIDGLEARVRVLASHVQGQCNYTAIEFGRRSRIPKKASETVGDGHGDCKDHSLLLHQLLTSAGIEAHLTLTIVSGRVDPELPSLDQFDHMIVYVPDLGDGRYLDATDKHADPIARVPLGLGGRHALVLDAEKPRLLRIPDSGPEGSQIRITRKIHPTTRGGARVETHAVLTGRMASSLRSYLVQREPSDRLLGLQDWLGGSRRGFSVASLDVKHLDDSSAPLEVTLDYELGNWLEEVDGKWIGRLPALWERAYISARPEPNRRNPFKAVPFRVSSRSVVHSAKLVNEDISVARSKENRPHVGWTVSPTLAGGEFIVESSATFDGGTHGAKGHGDFVDAKETLLADIERRLVLRH